MPKVVSAITATVEHITALKDGDYGPYKSVLFFNTAEPPGSEEAKIWKSMSEEEVQPLRKGMIVQLVPAGKTKNGKEKHSIVLLEGKATPVVSSKASPREDQAVRLTPKPLPLAPKRPEGLPPTWDLDTKKRLSALICDQADLYLFTIQTVQHKFGDSIGQHEQVTIATTLFLQAVGSVEQMEPLEFIRQRRIRCLSEKVSVK